MHNFIRTGLLLTMLLALFSTPALPQSAPRAVAAADCPASGHLLAAPTVNRDPTWASSQLLAVGAAGVADVWAVGTFQPGDPLKNSQGALIMHWNGSTWQPVDHPGAAIRLGQTTSLSGIAVIDA